MQNNQEMNKRALTISEAAEYACVSRGSLQNWVDSGLIPFEELPSRGSGSHRFRLIRKTDLDDFLDQYYHAPDKKKNEINRSELILLPK